MYEGVCDGIGEGQMIKIAICDDEAVFRKEIRECCVEYCKNEQLECDIEEYAAGRALIKDKISPDILFLDVQMPEADGIEVKEHLKNIKSDTKILFISSYPESMRAAFGGNVFGFLEKPFKYKEFAEKMGEMLEALEVDLRFIICKPDSGEKKVYLREIVYIEAYGKYSKVHVRGGDNYILEEKSISKYEDELGEDFVRCHRSYIVNLLHVLSVKDKKIRLTKGKELPIGRSYEPGTKERYGEYTMRRF